jgi:hypothetical protein
MTKDLTNKTTTTVSIEALETYLNTRKLTSVGGRLLFGIDATASRSLTWSTACNLQAGMFYEAGDGLSVSLVYYRGLAGLDAECKATRWVTRSAELEKSMRKIECVTGKTQIGKILRHALREHEQAAIQALIFVGDVMEENIDELAALATKLGAQKLPVFMFQEGDDAEVEKAFKTIAERSGGAYFKFGVDSAQAVAQFANDLNTVAKLAVGDASAIAAITHNNEK